MDDKVVSAEKVAGKPHFNGAITIQGSRTQLGSRHDEQKKLREKEANKAYGRGKKINVKGVRDRKLRRNLTSLENKYQSATAKAKDAEILLENTGGFLEPETELERTWKVGQKQIAGSSTIETAQKKFELKLDSLGPYTCEYSRNGRDLLLAGRKGHIATMDWREGKLGCELQLGETIRDAKWLHNDQYFAVSQKNYVYIYDNRGVELHCLKQHREVTHMEFLPYHFLLGTIVSTHGFIFPVQSLTGNSPHRVS
jgi:U3 small nucleolar RNA-associated protein 7